MFDILGLAGAAQVVDTHREVLEPLAERVVVLEGQHCGGYQHGGLLAIDCSLERGTDGYLGLAEAYVAAHEAIHGFGALHVGLDGLCGLELVGRVLVDERCLKLLLQVAVGREGVALLLASLGIELDEVAGDVLETTLGARLDLVPCAAAQLV